VTRPTIADSEESTAEKEASFQWRIVVFVIVLHALIPSTGPDRPDEKDTAFMNESHPKHVVLGSQDPLSLTMK
jgi:hypothetical protein